MKEITRIHLAKVAYDIELDAKKDIQGYIAALEHYANDPELLSDIEIRITELLAERGVAAGGVIAKDDVAAVRERLGEPSDFAGEGADIKEDAEEEPRRVYRDENEAILGGVLAGIAKYFTIDPLWVRLVFIVLLIASFGTALVVYVVLWIIVPPARTAAEKLRMNGRPVTLASIKALGERAEPAVGETARVMRNIFRIGLGILLVLGAFGALAGVAGVVGMPFVSDMGWRMTDAWWLLVGFGLAALAGVLLAVLCLVLAGSVFRRHWSRRTSIAVIAIIIAGIISFFGGLGTVWYGESAQFSERQDTSTVQLPAKFSAVQSLTIGGDGRQQYGTIHVEYIVSDKNYYELFGLSGMKPRIEISPDGTSATVWVEGVSDDRGPRWWIGPQSTLYIYGPALSTITTKSGTLHYYNSLAQERLAVRSESDTVTLAGSFGHVSVDNKDAWVDLRDAAIERLEIVSSTGRTAAGVVRELIVTQPDVCTAWEVDNEQSQVQVQAVSSGMITYNGEKRPAETIRSDCGSILIGSDSNDDTSMYY